MKKRLQHLILKNRTKALLTTFTVLTLGIVILSNTNGPARNGNLVTGAPFNAKKTCTKCHSGGKYGAAIKLQLLDSATLRPVTSYSPGGKYKFRISLTDTSVKVQKYGFQTTSATLANVNLNRWGVIPSNTHNSLKSGRNYVEHNAPLSSGIITLPWTAPIRGTGTVKFYTAGNVVNNTGSTSGDQPVNDSLYVTEGLAPLFALNSETNNINSKPVYSLAPFAHAGEKGALFNNGGAQQKAQVFFSDIQGNILYTNNTVMNQGANLVPIPNNGKVKGIVILSVITSDGIRTSLKIGLNQ